MDFFALLSKEFGEEEANKLIDGKISSFSGLLTREAAAKLIASENGFIKEEWAKISELRPGAQSVNVRGVVEKVFPLQEYASGKRSRAFALADETGEINVRLWNEDAEKLSSLHIGDRVEVRGAYEKMDSLNLGYKGRMDVVGKAEMLPPDSLEKGRVNCIGKVHEIGGYTEKEGRKVFSFIISGGEKELPVFLPAPSRKGEHLTEGDSVLLEGAEFDGEKLFLGAHSRILVRKSAPNIFRGPLGGIKREGGEWILEVGGEEFLVRKPTLIKFLNLEGLKEDIDLQRVVDMKLPGLKGRNAVLVFEKGESGKEAKEAALR